MDTKNLVTLADNATLDDIEDLPEFLTPHSGAYQVIFPEGGVRKEINEHPACEWPCKVEAVLELSEKIAEGEKVVGSESQFSFMFMLDNKFGVGNYKKFLAEFAIKLGTRDLKALESQGKNVRAMVVVKREKDKEDDEKFYVRLKSLTIL